MKSKLILTAMAVCISYEGFAQTKGTNMLGLGVNSYKVTSSTVSSGNENKTNGNAFNLGYSHFIKENSKIGLDLFLSVTKQEVFNGSTLKTNGYGANVNYQKYYPIVKTLFAYAGGRGGYNYSKQTSAGLGGFQNSRTDYYSVGAYGGVTWFMSKRFALETSLLSANIGYLKNKTIDGSVGADHVSTQTSFDLNTEGFISDLGFKIYLLF
jgi:hypothetical protein